MSPILTAIKLLLAVILVWPAVALAHHPGALGPINHLGFEQVSAVAAAALLDGINPTALGVLLLLLWQGVKQQRSARRIGFYYILGIISTYLAVGILLRQVYLNFGPSVVVQGFQILLAGLLFLSGLSELSDAIRPRQRKLISVPDPIKKGLQKFTGWLESGLAFPMGMAIGLLELFATGAIYLAFIQAITYDPTAPTWVLLTMMGIYILMFALPLLAVLIYQPLVEILMSPKSVTRSGRAVRGTAGVLFMLAAGFVAASAFVTIQSSVDFWWL